MNNKQAINYLKLSIFDRAHYDNFYNIQLLYHQQFYELIQALLVTLLIHLQIDCIDQKILDCLKKLHAYFLID